MDMDRMAVILTGYEGKCSAIPQETYVGYNFGVGTIGEQNIGISSILNPHVLYPN